jgi:hypothetical protein
MHYVKARTAIDMMANFSPPKEICEGSPVPRKQISGQAEKEPRLSSFIQPESKVPQKQ